MDNLQIYLWKVGDNVWLETTNLHMNGPKKLQMKWTGPVEFEEVIVMV